MLRTVPAGFNRRNTLLSNALKDAILVFCHRAYSVKIPMNFCMGRVQSHFRRAKMGTVPGCTKIGTVSPGV
jgi:hypothetical protein